MYVPCVVTDIKIDYASQEEACGRDFSHTEISFCGLVQDQSSPSDQRFGFQMACRPGVFGLLAQMLSQPSEQTYPQMGNGVK
jgi:hypothetical protein